MVVIGFILYTKNNDEAKQHISQNHRSSELEPIAENQVENNLKEEKNQTEKKLDNSRPSPVKTSIGSTDSTFQKDLNQPQPSSQEGNNKSKGDAFEKFIVQKFNRKFFTIKEWAGDKYVNGRFAETTLNPDLILELELNSSKYSLAVECKWKQNFYKNGVEFATKEQVERYKNYETKNGIPVFLAIGIGGKPSAPENLYIIPLSKIDNNFLRLEQLELYKKSDDKKFFFDINTKDLR